MSTLLRRKAFKRLSSASTKQIYKLETECLKQMVQLT